MTFWLRMFMARFKTASTLSFWLALLMAVILAAGQIFNQDNGLRIQVGIFLEADDSPILSRVEYYAGADCAIIVYDDLTQMRLDVAANKLECAYIFPTDHKIPVTAFRSDWTVSAGVLDLLMASAYIEGLAGEFGEEAVAGFIETDLPIADTIQQMTEDYLRDGALMETIYVETGDRVGEQAAPYRRLFRGLTGLFGLLLALLYGLGLGGTDAALAGRLRMAGRSSGRYALVGVAAAFAVTWLFMMGTLGVGNFLYPGVVTHWAAEIGTATAFAFAVASGAVWFAGKLNADGAGLIAFIFIAAALLGGTAFDIREVWAAAAFARFIFPNYYYLEGQAWVLAGFGLVVSLLVGRGE